MKSEDLIDSMKEIIRCYEEMNNPESSISLEIRRWRDNFLIQKDLGDDKRRQAIEMYFHSIPSETFVKYSIGECLDRSIKAYDSRLADR